MLTSPDVSVCQQTRDKRPSLRPVYGNHVIAVGWGSGQGGNVRDIGPVGLVKLALGQKPIHSPLNRPLVRWPYGKCGLNEIKVASKDPGRWT